MTAMEYTVADEIMSYLTGTNEEYLQHYGMPRRSGRYPWGSGEDPYQHGSNDFLGRLDSLKANGWEETAENIKKDFGMSVKQFRSEKSWSIYERRLYQTETAKRLRDKEGLTPTEIGKRMGVNESTVRGWFKPDAESRMKQAAETADFLKKRLKETGGYLDVGKSVDKELNISRERLDTALYALEREGYIVVGGRMDQVTNPNQKTTMKILCPPGTPYKENASGQKTSSAVYDLENIHTVKDYISRDDGKTFEKKFNYPASLDSKRLMVRYAEDGGTERDGLVELRRNVPDLSLGESRYSQVRIMVDGKKYIKGMAVYSDDMPDGVDVIFNTNKSNKLSKLEVLKDIKNDPDNPFGSLIKDADQGGQYWYDSKTGQRISGASDNPNKKLGLINKRADEGDWGDWADALPSQFLGKQSLKLARQQLDMARKDKEAEFNEIMSLTNPTVKKYYLNKFSEQCDSAAVDLKAAALPGQKYHVMVPINTLDDKHIYAPGYPEGSKLALIRYPHGGTFEIPILTVTHKNELGEKTIGKTSLDAVGLNHKIAEQLSGADFDGDTVMCIPTHDPKGKVKIANKPYLDGLKGFEPKLLYQYDEVKTEVNSDGKEIKHYYRNGQEFKIMRDTQKQMGVISNLITDMTLAGADDDEIVRAVKHSMVVIDAEKHKLDYKKSEIENDIAALRNKYQVNLDENGNPTSRHGASTLLSRSKGEVSIARTQGSPKINIKGTKDYDPTRPEGALIYKKADDLYYPVRKYDRAKGEVTYKTADGKKITYNVNDKDAVEKYEPVKKVAEDGTVSFTNRKGDVIYQTDYKKQTSTKMKETDDAYTLVSEARHPMELVYADYANSMKALANRARVALVNAGKIAYDRKAKDLYRTEVESLMEKLNNAELNAVRERTAVRKANIAVNKKKALAEAAGETLKTADVKKVAQQALTRSRQEVGSIRRSERNIEITDKEWEAIQAGAISESRLIRILNNTNADELRQRAMPKRMNQLSQSQISRIQAFSASYTIQEIADKMGISTATVSKYLKGA